MAEKIVIDATNLILGRMGTYAAKKALTGSTIDIINCEQSRFGLGRDLRFQAIQYLSQGWSHFLRLFLKMHASLHLHFGAVEAGDAVYHVARHFLFCRFLLPDEFVKYV